MVLIKSQVKTLIPFMLGLSCTCNQHQHPSDPPVYSTILRIHFLMVGISKTTWSWGFFLSWSLVVLPVRMILCSQLASFGS